MLSLLPAVFLRALSRRAFRLARKVNAAAVRAEARELAEGGYYLHPAAVAVGLVVCIVLTALAEGA